MLSKKAIIIPTVTLVLISFILLPLSCFAQKTGTKKYNINSHGLVNLCGKKFTYTKSTVDTIEMDDDRGEAKQKIIKTEGWPVAMDGKSIADQPPVFNVDVEQHLYKRMKKELSYLEDGYYNLGIYNIIIDDKGLTCAFSYEGMSGSKAEAGKATGQSIHIDKKTQDIIFNKASNELANFPAYDPPVINGKKVVSVSNPIYPNQFKVERRKVYIKKKGSWKEI